VSKLPFLSPKTGGLCSAVLTTVAAGLLLACSASGQGSDLRPADLGPAEDLAAGPSCGQIVLCTVSCGLGKLQCDTQCAVGANQTEGSKAAKLALCAVLHCASSDGGTGLPSILSCLLSSCPAEVAACDGLPL
jgi:hypothetical protein